jgi:hypothetical protein
VKKLTAPMKRAADLIRSMSEVYVGDRICSICLRRTDRIPFALYLQQREQLIKTRVLRDWCGGFLLPAYDTRLREVLAGLAAETTSTPAAATAEADCTAPPTR